MAASSSAVCAFRGPPALSSALLQFQRDGVQFGIRKNGRFVDKDLSSWDAIVSAFIHVTIINVYKPDTILLYFALPLVLTLHKARAQLISFCLFYFASPFCLDKFFIADRNLWNCNRCLIGDEVCTVYFEYHSFVNCDM